MFTLSIGYIVIKIIMFSYAMYHTSFTLRFIFKNLENIFIIIAWEISLGKLFEPVKSDLLPKPQETAK